MDMIICSLALAVVEGGHALHTVPPAEPLCKVREYLLRLVLRIDFGQGDNQFPCFDTFALCAAALKLLLAFPCKVAPKGAVGGAVGGIEIFLPCMACNIRYSPFDIGQFLSIWIKLCLGIHHLRFLLSRCVLFLQPFTVVAVAAAVVTALYHTPQAVDTEAPPARAKYLGVQIEDLCEGCIFNSQTPRA